MTGKPVRLVLLPGLHGTAELFAPLLEILPSHIRPVPVSYPASLQTFEHYVRFASTIAEAEADADTVLLAESFSGPIGLALLENPPANVVALVLVATFAEAPYPSLRRLARFVPAWAIRAGNALAIRCLCANGPGNGLIAREAAAVVAKVPVELLKRRFALLDTSRREQTRQHGRAPPVLFLNPTRDRLIPAKRFASRSHSGDSQMVRQIDGPHFLLQCCPSACWRAIEDFIQSHVREREATTRA